MYGLHLRTAQLPPIESFEASIALGLLPLLNFLGVARYRGDLVAAGKRPHFVGGMVSHGVVYYAPFADEMTMQCVAHCYYYYTGE